MMKASIELFKVHKSCKVKFSLFVKDDTESSFQKLIGKYMIGGNEYLKITPYPFITIDISSKMDKKEEWNSNQAFNLNRRDLFFFIKKGRRLLKNFIEHKDLFFYDTSGKLSVKTTLADQLKEIVIASNKRILLQACVVENEDDHNYYEGIFLSINSIDYFTYLTYMELEFLIFELSKIDMSSLSMQLINTVYLTEKIEADKIAPKAPVVETKEEEILDIKPRILIDEPSTIPEI